jgi:hypothetical protein
MTGVQESSIKSTDNVLNAELPGDLSADWTDMEVVRAVFAAIPKAKREKAIAALMALVGSGTTDANRESFNA